MLKKIVVFSVFLVLFGFNVKSVEAQVPNCSSVSGPTTLTAGQTYTYQATYSQGSGPVTDVGMYSNQGATCFSGGLNTTQHGGAGTYSFSWTPAAAGAYTVCCRAWNDGIAECRGNCVDGPPRYLCAGPGACLSVTVCSPISAPSGLSPSGTIVAGVRNITWNAVSGALYYPLRVDDLANGWTGTCASVNPGDVCVDNLTGTSYSYNFQAGHTYNIWVHAYSSCGIWSSATSSTVTVSIPGRIQGRRVNGPTGTSTTVTVNGIGSYSLPAHWSSYSTGDVLTSGGSYTVSTTVPAGYTASYSICNNCIDHPDSSYVTGSSVTVTVPTSAASGFTFAYVDLYWKYSPAVPNCSITAGTSTITLGQSGTYTANYSSPGINVDAEMNAGKNGSSIVWQSSHDNLGALSGSKTYTWTPTQTGTYDVFCRAWNDGFSECIGNYNYHTPSNPLQVACAGPNSSMTVTVTEAPPTPQPTNYFNMDPAGVVSGTSFGGNITGKMSVPLWQVADSSENISSFGTKQAKYGYAFFEQRLENIQLLGDDPGPNVINNLPNGAYKVISGLNISNNVNITLGEKIVILVPGNLTIRNKINVDPGGFIAFIVRGDITVVRTLGANPNSKSDKSLQGVYITDKTFYDTDGGYDKNKRFNGDGTFIADADLDSNGGFSFARDLEDNNAQYPADYFEYRPDFLVNFPPAFGVRTITWREVAP